MSQPLLASSRPSSEQSDDRAGAEEDALLAGQRPVRQDATGGTRYGWKFWREVGLFAWATLATVAVIVLAALYQHQIGHHKNVKGHDGAGGHTGKRNVIFMVSDGMGPTSLSLTRSFRQFRDDLPPGDVLVLDNYLIGSSRTRSTSSLVTDSAAGATAFSCGLKTYNGGISILPDHSPCGTVLEAAKEAGYMTGLVVTTRITDATPACFAAHVNMRSEEDRIAEQEVGDHPLGRVVDLILGGGRCHFLPKSMKGSCRDDEKDVIALAKSKGFTYVHDRQGFDKLERGNAVDLPLLGLIAETDIPYEVDRRFMQDQYPSLDEMTQTALEALTRATRDSDKGFFLMIEGSRIDHAGHANDPVAQVHEVLAYDKAFSRVVKYLEDSDTDGVLISTSDHETGGLATARQLHESYPEYLWYPGVLSNASSSAERLSHRYRERRGTSTDDETLRKFIKEDLLEAGLGVRDASRDEVRLLMDRPEISAYTFADIVSRRAQVGWTTHGHSAVDVNIYGSGATSALEGNHENTEVGLFMRDYMGLDLEHITKKLVDAAEQFDIQLEDGTKKSWMGALPESGKNLNSFDHYHGDF